MRSLLSDVIQSVSKSQTHKRINFEVNITNETPVEVQGDSNSLSKSIKNLAKLAVTQVGIGESIYLTCRAS